MKESRRNVLKSSVAALATLPLLGMKAKKQEIKEIVVTVKIPTKFAYNTAMENEGKTFELGDIVEYKFPQSYFIQGTKSWPDTLMGEIVAIDYFIASKSHMYRKKSTEIQIYLRGSKVHYDGISRPYVHGVDIRKIIRKVGHNAEI